MPIRFSLPLSRVRRLFCLIGLMLTVAFWLSGAAYASAHCGHALPEAQTTNAHAAHHQAAPREAEAPAARTDLCRMSERCVHAGDGLTANTAGAAPNEGLLDCLKDFHYCCTTPAAAAFDLSCDVPTVSTALPIPRRSQLVLTAPAADIFRPPRG